MKDIQIDLIKRELSDALKHWESLNIILIVEGSADEEVLFALQYALELIDERINDLKHELDTFGVTVD